MKIKLTVNYSWETVNVQFNEYDWDISHPNYLRHYTNNNVRICPDIILYKIKEELYNEYRYSSKKFLIDIFFKIKIKDRPIIISELSRK